MKTLLPLLLISVMSLKADVIPSQLFHDNMVIKRNTSAPVWGTADPDEKVTVTASWGESESTKADENGKWKLLLKTPKAGGPHTLIFKGKNEIKIKEVLSGDVWHASGQSNMQMTLEKCTDIDKENLNFPQVRRLRVLHNSAKEPQSFIAGLEPWTPVSSDILKSTSATAYFFARSLFQKTGVPQGIIETPWNGKALEPFYAAQELKELYPEEYSAMVKHPTFGKEEGKFKRRIPNSKEFMPNENHFGWVFNAKIAPIIPYAISGAIWYQGESNAGNKLLYKDKLKYLIGSWRKAWGQGDFPFYFVQLNSNKPTDGTPADGLGFAGIIEGMRRAYSEKEIPNIGMATIWDTGNPKNYTPKPGTREGGIMLHCPNKRDVGIRLSLWALRDIYKQKDTVVSGPMYKSHRIEGSKIILEFDHIGSGLIAAEKRGFEDPVPTSRKKLNNFAIAGEDQKFVWAEAEIVGNTVVVSSSEIPEPKAVRFCFNSAPFKYFNFYNKEGLPASPFITDKWYK